MDRSGSLRTAKFLSVPNATLAIGFLHSWGQWIRATLHAPPLDWPWFGGRHRRRIWYLMEQRVTLLGIHTQCSLAACLVNLWGAILFHAAWLFPLHGCVYNQRQRSIRQEVFVIHLGHTKVSCLSILEKRRRQHILHDCSQFHVRPICLRGHPFRFEVVFWYCRL